jgi:hypothetical protein
MLAQSALGIVAGVTLGASLRNAFIGKNELVSMLKKNFFLCHWWSSIEWGHNKANM